MIVTQKQLRNFMRSERLGLDGIGFNDAWNKEHFGLTITEAAEIRTALIHEYGLVFPTHPDLKLVNARLKSK